MITKWRRLGFNLTVVPSRDASSVCGKEYFWHAFVVPNTMCNVKTWNSQFSHETFPRPKPQFLSRHKVTRWTASFSGKAICFCRRCLPVPFRHCCRRRRVSEWRHLLQQRHRGLAHGLNHSHGNAQSWVLADKHKHSPYREAQAWRDYSLTAPTDWRPRHWRRAGNRQRVRRRKKRCQLAVARLPSIVRDKNVLQGANLSRVAHGKAKGAVPITTANILVENKVISLFILNV